MSNIKYSHSRLALAIGTALAASATQAATITVDTLQDPGDPSECSLRSAVQAVYDQSAVYGCAAGDGVNDEIVFESGLSGTLTLADGQIDLYAPVSIVGPGSENLTIDAQGASRVFLVANPNDVELSGVTLTGGYAYADFGGAIYVTAGSALTLSDCVVSGNYASENGGGIEVFYASLSVNNCVFSGNTSLDNGGAIAVTDGSAVITGSEFTQNSSGLGGALMVNEAFSGPQLQSGQRGAAFSTLEVNDSLISGNSAQIGGGIGVGYFDGGGGKLDARNGVSSTQGEPPGIDHSLRVVSSQITGNSAFYLGGGIGSLSGPELYGPESDSSGRGLYVTSAAVYNSEVSSNYSYYYGGGIGSVGGTVIVLDGQVSDNMAYLSGGGIHFVGPDGGVNPPPNLGGGWRRGQIGPASDLTVAFSSVSGNAGGGIVMREGNAELFGSQVDGNSESFVGGLECGYAAQCVVAYSSISNNSGEVFGGLLADVLITRQAPARGVAGSLILNSSTISGNSGGYVGGLRAFDAQIAHSTIAFNEQTGLGGPALQGGGSNAVGGLSITDQSSLSHVLVSDNSSIDGSNDVDTGGAYVTMNFSLIGDSTGLTYTGTDNLLDVDPLLGPLDANGSAYSLTHALQDGSPAINAGDAAIASSPDYDQRGPGFDRIIDGVVDIGAFEFAGVVEPEVGLSLSQIDFAGTLVGLDDSAQLTISSIGTDDLNLGQLSFVAARGVIPFGLANDNCSGQVLTPGSDCTVDVTFQPPGRGQFDANLLVPSNAPDSPAEVAVSGAGVAPELAISAPTINFGNVTVGDSVDDSVVLTNVGDADLDLTGSDVAAPFSVVAGAGLCLDGGTTTLAPTEACTLTFRFEPVIEGPAGQTVNVASNSLGGDSTVDLSGVGVTGAPPVDPAVPVPIMGRVGTMLLAGGLLMLGLFGLRRRIG